MRMKRVICLAIALLLTLILVHPASAAVEPEILKNDDWRYRALSELAAHGILDIKDSPYYLTKIPINVDFAVASLERSLVKLGIKDIDFSNAATLDLSLYGTAVKNLNTRDAWLLNDLVKEFAQKLAQRGVVGKPAAIEESVAPAPAATLPGATTEPSQPQPEQQSAAVLSLSDVLKKINMPSAVSQASLTKAPQQDAISEAASRIEPTPIGPASTDSTKTISLFEVLNVNASLFTDEQATEEKSSAGVGLKIGDDQGAGLVLDYRMIGGKDSYSNLTDLTAATGVGIKYQINSIVPLNKVEDSITIKAGYNIESGDLKNALDNGLDLQASASLSIYYKMLLGDSAFLAAGYQVEQVRNLIASGAMSTKSWMYDDSSPLAWIFRGSLSLNSDSGVKQLAGIDVGYKLFKDASIMVGYRLIDFSDFNKLDLRKNLTALGISIKF